MQPKKVILKGDPIYKEAKAASAIVPGELIDINATGELVKHATAGGNAAKYFAVEQDYLGKSIGDAATIGDRIPYAVCRPGDEVYAFVAAGQNVAIGAYLESAGNGALKAHTAVGDSVPVQALVARAIEAVNNAGGSPARIKVEVL